MVAQIIQTMVQVVAVPQRRAKLVPLRIHLAQLAVINHLNVIATFLLYFLSRALRGIMFLYHSLAGGNLFIHCHIV